MTKEEVEKKTILRATVGSTVHGLNVEGQDDRDEMGICIEPMRNVIGFDNFEQYIYRDQPEGVRSQPGDLDLTIYSLRKWCRLALKGNPSILLLLFVPKQFIIVQTQLGIELQNLSEAFVSRQAGKAFLGYLKAQKERMLGTRGQKRSNRPELIEKYGFDVKYAMHMIRLGLQGIELLETGRITLPMVEKERETVYSIRTGKLTMQQVLDYCEYLEESLKWLLLSSSLLPKEPDTKRVEDFLMKAYLLDSENWLWKNIQV